MPLARDAAPMLIGSSDIDIPFNHEPETSDRQRVEECIIHLVFDQVCRWVLAIECCELKHPPLKVYHYSVQAMHV